MSLRPATLRRVFWRCLFLQAAWNRRGMQNLGFAFAIDPALRELYPDPAARLRALERHLGFFNCHPYMAAAIVGGAIQHEERVARGEEPPGAPAAYKATLQGPLAAVGDGFFWTALRPFFGALAAVGALLLGWPAVAAAVAAYNAVHLWLRWRFFRDGYRHGDEVVLDIRNLALPARAERLRVGAAALCGLAAAVVVVRAGAALGAEGGLLAAAGAAGGYLALRRGLPLLWMAYAALAAGAGLGLALAARGGP
ncbi:MAG TPA: PTS system mannose/fructose/sorbose family transporter subunit IID [Anaeromyxobacteraceae bacterium]|nr:PTS system mannose/fructose/sorbose family transporter subunit IID [Anaeromyxobacteraceae bacterium]